MRRAIHVHRNCNQGYVLPTIYDGVCSKRRIPFNLQWTVQRRSTTKINSTWKMNELTDSLNYTRAMTEMRQKLNITYNHYPADWSKLVFTSPLHHLFHQLHPHRLLSRKIHLSPSNDKYR